MTVKNGYLIIAIKKEDWIGSDNLHPRQAVTRRYTSGEISTINNAVWTYGRFEVRVKLPEGQGLMPYILLYPTDNSWPPDISILTSSGQFPEEIYFINTWGVDSRHQGSKWLQYCSGDDYSADFHTFALEWEPHILRWYIDDLPKFEIDQNIPDRPLCLILGTSVGGIYAGDPYETKLKRSSGRPSSFPQYFVIDRVRVYQRR